MPDILVELFLRFSSLDIVVLIVLAGFLLIDRRFFYQTSCLLTFNILLNVALKGTFKIPLSPALHVIGYAFPSGHMQLATVFYGWIALHWTRRSARLAIVVLLAGIGAGLMHFGYHTLSDVLAALVVGLGLIAVFQGLLTINAPAVPWILAICACLLLGYIRLIFYSIPQYCLISFYTLFALLIVERCNVVIFKQRPYW